MSTSTTRPKVSLSQAIAFAAYLFNPKPVAIPDLATLLAISAQLHAYAGRLQYQSSRRAKALEMCEQWGYCRKQDGMWIQNRWNDLTIHHHLTMIGAFQESVEHQIKAIDKVIYPILAQN